jgi:hypothetical protein
MKILCDTCCVLLIIRIVPEMFTDNRFRCFTIREVRDEIIQTQKFKAKYPWKTDYMDKIRITILTKEDKKSFDLHFVIIDQLVEYGTINNRTRRFFDLGYKDRNIIAYSLATDSQLATNDREMKDFVRQQFERSSLSSLALLNI